MKILLGVCGSIAAYKTFDLARGLIKNGHEVKVILTKGALNFIKPEVYKYLGISEVFNYNDDFNYPKLESDSGSVLHIELAKWADHLCIYPASANTISNLAFGKSDDLLTSIFLAKRDRTITSIFPAMNTFMYHHPLTRENIDLLKRINIVDNLFIHPPEKGELACGDTGDGKAPNINKVLNCIEAINPKISKDSPRVVITTGATLAPIDPVRFVTNSSSGKTGYQLAKESLKRGFQVEVIAGKYATSQLEDLLELPGFKLKRVITTSDMKDAVAQSLPELDIYISAAAISDIAFDMNGEKLKKDALENSLNFSQAPDILKFVLENKSEHQRIIGFAAETNLSHEVLQEKWLRKPVSLLVGTQVHNGLDNKNQEQGFSSNSAYYKLFKAGKIETEGLFNKEILPSLIFNNIESEVR